ncbi:uncharacterized protein LOC111369679 isoform X3 [Olea europaea var. sylvestris]|uniref:uncharacterized protein LOC111369679 isoform X3 n=1 Tax=Olea europaea var. sylvestris TaxID=158386 RepID=UPI000C1D5D6C|nr:uncharacterized protein LOC111369679 isoform X3 [Olea europaea var. sylvestris]
MRMTGVWKGSHIMPQTTWLLRKPATLLPEKYVLWRWRKDVTRSYTRVPTTYDGLVSTAEQLRYERFCLACTKMANLVAANEEQSDHLLE